MAVQLDPSGKDDKNDIKTHFVTREGVYRILNLSSEEFAVNPARPRPVGYQSNQSSPQVRVSIVSLPSAPLTAGSTTTAASSTLITTTSGNSGSGGGPQSSSSSSNLINTTGISAAPNTSNLGNSTLGTTNSGSSANTNGQQQQDNGNGQGGDRICFNIGKELYVYSFKGIRKVGIIFRLNITKSCQVKEKQNQDNLVTSLSETYFILIKLNITPPCAVLYCITSRVFFFLLLDTLPHMLLLMFSYCAYCDHCTNDKQSKY